MLKIPLFPEYATVAALLKLLNGTTVASFKSMWNAIWELTGTPQNSVTWTDPDAWIEERLSGTDKATALNIWLGSNKTVNPRWIRGDQFLINGYKLIEEVSGLYSLTDRGKVFISKKDNAIAREIDKEEGLIQLLLQAAALDKGKRADFLGEWKSYLDTNSNVREDNVVKEYLRRRLINLKSRAYLSREGNSYAITGEGLAYLKAVNENNQDTTLSRLTVLSRDVEKFNKEQRDLFRTYLEKTTPAQFERLVRDLLNAMGYEDIKVTAITNDKGVDVTAVSQQGITTVKEVIQVKRFTKANVQRPVLDSLRGSLHRFDAFQGTIITLSDFAKGARDAAYEKGAAPITLINGEKLIDMLIANNLIIKKKHLEYYSIDESYFDHDSEMEIE
ncbi:restriction system protein [Chitinophaga ginsengisegetis]|uniref:Restriction system protein n=1 Tax=Chitinophaga ginsengisegetis TaxID=393003 RepID=A0A1T5PCH7_9BACT|nr:restriction endonuclease [Chitinophaga ginsengisegetis]MDR6571311.1 restriction system protein [Chitinophaga ginsengisegetis]MDR6651045.1 restriction system protein [Chitinophaga ginsengisegetis]MDR6657395.1 restriction system protein [Chitinophaga ginsengisegetis]SKD09969.1 restriction system protein [Chitinophaga ginsengisegetis]